MHAGGCGVALHCPPSRPTTRLKPSAAPATWPRPGATPAGCCWRRPITPRARSACASSAEAFAPAAPSRPTKTRSCACAWRTKALPSGCPTSGGRGIAWPSFWPGPALSNPPWSTCGRPSAAASATARRSAPRDHCCELSSRPAWAMAQTVCRRPHGRSPPNRIARVSPGRSACAPSRRPQLPVILREARPKDPRIVARCDRRRRGSFAAGLFKTPNGGSHWINVSDGYFNTAAVGAIAVSDSDPNVVYAGTGEACIRSNVSHGDGVYRSDDAGRTWRNVGLAPTRHISRVAIHPTNPDVVYVAAVGHAWGPNPERGVYRSQTGGASWDLVLHKSATAGAADLTLDIRNPRVLYAAIWQGRRFPHAAESGGPDSGIWRSLDGGESWTELTRNKGLPTGLLGRIGVTTSPAQPGRVWALVESEDGAMFRSDDYGESWERLSENADLRRRPWYYMHAYADPQDPNTVWVLNLDCWRSVYAGKTFGSIPTPHGDNHGRWSYRRSSDRVVEGNDGGATVTFDGGRTWSSLLNQPTAQFYHVTTDEKVPYGVYGSQQDNWAMRVPSVSFEGAISWRDYVEPGGGESGYIAISKRPPYTVFGGGTGTGAGHGRLIAWNPETGQKRNVTVWPEVFGMGAGAESLRS